MMILMNDSLINTIEDISKFLNSLDKVEFERCTKSTEVTYGWVEKSLVKFSYLLLSKPEKGLVKKYIEKITGYSRAQVTRLVEQYAKTGHIKSNTGSTKKHRFNRKYNSEDIRLIANTSLIHNKPNVSVSNLNALERKHTDYQMAEMVQEKLAKMYKVLNHEMVPASMVRSGSSID